MTNEHERLPRAVELAANIVAGHVRKTETSPDRFASLLMTAYEGIRNLERVAANPDAAIAPSLSAAAIPVPAPVEAPRVQSRQTASRQPPRQDDFIDEEPGYEAPRQAAPRQQAPRQQATRQQATRQQPRQEAPRLDLHEEQNQPEQRQPQNLRYANRPSTDEDRASGYVRDGRQTVYHDRLICLDDGKEVTFLGRHLRLRGSTEEEYRQRWDLPTDYPMTTQAYVDQKKAAARRTGFGTSVRPDRETRPQEESRAAPAPAPAPAPTPTRRQSARRAEGTLRPSFN